MEGQTDREEGHMTLGSCGVASQGLPRTAGNHRKSGDGHGTKFPAKISGAAWPCRSAALISSVWRSSETVGEYISAV